MIRVGILKISDRYAHGDRVDEVGPAIRQMLPEYYEVVHYKIVSNEPRVIQEKLIQWAPQCDLILTTGGTGFSPRDLTPEATAAVIDREVPGLSEAIRAAGLSRNPRAMLSRGISGIRQQTLIINLPGSPDAAVAGLEVILPALDYGIERLRRESASPAEAEAAE